MIGIIYLALSMLVGKEVSDMLFSVTMIKNGATGRKTVKINKLWIMFAASFGIGVLIFGWITYIVSWGASAAGANKPLIYGNAFVIGLMAVLLAVTYVKRYKKCGTLKSIFNKNECEFISDRAFFIKECIVFGILLVFFTSIMFYVFFIRDGVLYSGYSVYGDYAPHTAMMRSFSRGNNFPTEYPHFGGQDIKYHFMFQFFVGNLEFLGMRIDIAYNLVSVLALLGFMMLLYSIAMRITGSFAACILTFVLFMFRSSLSFFRFVIEHLMSGDLIQTLADNMSFIGYTTNESWGLWNFNVYLNQRHLAYGLLIVCLVIWVFMDYLEAGCADSAIGVKWLKNRIFTKRAWKSLSIENALMLGMILGLTSFWNGAAVIGGLLILFGLAIFSDSKFDYLVMAVTAVIFSVLQTKIFIWGDAVSPSFYWGFLAENKSISGVLWYLLQMSGVFFIGAVLLVIFIRSKSKKAMLISFLLPTVFAFCASLTPDIDVNHKYIMISYAFLAIFWALVIVRLFERKKLLRMVAVILTVCLTITGIYDFVIIIRNNGEGRRVSVNMNSALTDWLSANLTHDDLLLTPEYSMNEVTMSGVMLYMGWPYYAWSAGYDTYDRADKAKTIYSSTDVDEIKSIVKEEKITYILYEEGMEYEQQTCHEETIAATYTLVYESEDGRIRVYETC